MFLIGPVFKETAAACWRVTMPITLLARAVADIMPSSMFLWVWLPVEALDRSLNQSICYQINKNLDLL